MMGDVPLQSHIEQWQAGHADVHRVERLERTAAAESLFARLDEMNQFRQQLTSERTEYITRREHDIVLDRIGDLQTQLARLTAGLAVITVGVVSVVVKVWTG